MGKDKRNSEIRYFQPCVAGDDWLVKNCYLTALLSMFFLTECSILVLHSFLFRCSIIYNDVIAMQFLFYHFTVVINVFRGIYLTSLCYSEMNQSPYVFRVTLS